MEIKNNVISTIAHYCVEMGKELIDIVGSYVILKCNEQEPHKAITDRKDVQEVSKDL